VSADEGDGVVRLSGESGGELGALIGRRAVRLYWAQAFVWVSAPLSLLAAFVVPLPHLLLAAVSIYSGLALLAIVTLAAAASRSACAYISQSLGFTVQAIVVQVSVARWQRIIEREKQRHLASDPARDAALGDLASVIGRHAATVGRVIPYCFGGGLLAAAIVPVVVYFTSSVATIAGLFAGILIIGAFVLIQVGSRLACRHISAVLGFPVHAKFGMPNADGWREFIRQQIEARQVITQEA
jgi:hypothetical protein